MVFFVLVLNKGYLLLMPLLIIPIITNQLHITVFRLLFVRSSILGRYNVKLLRFKFFWLGFEYETMYNVFCTTATIAVTGFAIDR